MQTKPFTNLHQDQELHSQTLLSLPDGTYLMIEIITQGTDGNFIIARRHLENDFTLTSSGYYEGSCSGKFIGGVTCPNDDPVLNCVKGTIGCGS